MTAQITERSSSPCAQALRCFLASSATSPAEASVMPTVRNPAKTPPRMGPWSPKSPQIRTRRTRSGTTTGTADRAGAPRMAGIDIITGIGLTGHTGTPGSMQVRRRPIVILRP
jgi:hypothetical protein